MTPGGTDDARHIWEAVAPAWERQRDRLFASSRAVSEWLVDQPDPRPGQTVLELTSGPGETGFLVAERLGPDGRLVSSDLVPAMVDVARRGAADRGLRNVEFQVIDAQDIERGGQSLTHLPGYEDLIGKRPLVLSVVDEAEVPPQTA